MLPGLQGRRLARALGAALPPCEGVAHHLGHSATAYLSSPFEHAAALTIDGQGENESASLGEWRGTNYRPIRSIHSPDSIGIVYGMLTDFLGMRAGWDEYKVMGMAAQGDPARFREAFGRLVVLHADGRYSTERTSMVFKPGYCEDMLTAHFGLPARHPADELEPVHFDLAAALQQATSRVVFHLLEHLRARSNARDLCYAGGLAQNSIINGEILRSGLFARVWVPPVPGDHGGALGAALLVEGRRSGRARRPARFSAFLGPEPSEMELLQALEEAHEHVTWKRPVNLCGEAARRLARGEILGWFQGRMEYGPRALGHRSILADPRTRATRDRLNRIIKHRESFRPFAGCVPRERAREFFELEGESRFMQFVVRLLPGQITRLEALDHAGTCRAQTVDAQDDPLLHELLLAFERQSGVPVLVNTSFNDADEPIVCSARDALRTFLATELDSLVLGPFSVERGARRAHSS
jgi:predicted NodU family carbamoyl transferase